MAAHPVQIGIDGGDQLLDSLFETGLRRVNPVDLGNGGRYALMSNQPANNGDDPLVDGHGVGSFFPADWRIGGIRTDEEDEVVRLLDASEYLRSEFRPGRDVTQVPSRLGVSTRKGHRAASSRTRCPFASKR